MKTKKLLYSSASGYRPGQLVFYEGDENEWIAEYIDTDYLSSNDPPYIAKDIASKNYRNLLGFTKNSIVGQRIHGTSLKRFIEPQNLILYSHWPVKTERFWYLLEKSSIS
jgi:hypothetical protein